MSFTFGAGLFGQTAGTFGNLAAVKELSGSSTGTSTAAATPVRSIALASSSSGTSSQVATVVRSRVISVVSAIRWNAEGGTANDTVTTANSVGSGTAFDDVHLETNGTLKYRSTPTAHGSRSVEVSTTAATSPQAYLAWVTAMGTVTTVYFRFYIYPTAYPLATTTILRTRSGSSTNRSGLAFTSLGKICALNGAGATITGTTTAALPLSQWTRVECKFVLSSTVGLAEVKLFTGDSSTPTETLTSAATQNFAGSTADRVIFALINGTTSFPVTYFDDFASSTVGYVGPYAGAVGTSTTSATPTRSIALAGSSVGTSTASATPTRSKALAGSAGGLATVSGATIATRSLYGSSLGGSGAAASLTSSRATQGASVGSSIASATIVRGRTMLAATFGEGTFGSGTFGGEVRNLSVGTSSAIAALARQRTVQTSSSGTSSVAVLATRRRWAATSSTGTSQVAGAVGSTHEERYVASSTGTSQASGSVLRLRKLVVSSDGTSALTASINRLSLLSGTVIGTSSTQAQLVFRHTHRVYVSVVTNLPDSDTTQGGRFIVITTEELVGVSTSGGRSTTVSTRVREGVSS